MNGLEMVDLLSSENQREILQRSSGRNVTPLACKIHPLNEALTGFLGQHFHVTIQYEADNGEKAGKYFLKLLNGSFKTIFEISQELHSYEKEEFIYMQLLPEMQQHSIDVTFAPRGYFCKPYLIVLEDMSLKGFKMFENTLCFDIDHLKKAIEALVKFHTSGVIFEHVKSQNGTFSLYENNKSQLAETTFSNKGDNLIAKWFKGSLDGLFSLTGLILKSEEEHRVFRERLDILIGKLDEEKDNDLGLCTMLHGDLWSNNFLFAYENGKPIDSVLLDYQLLNYGPPAKDLIHLIFSNCSRSSRDQHLSDLCDYYYQCFSNGLLQWNLNAEKLLPKPHFLDLCAAFQPFTKLFCICDRFMTCMPKEFLLKHSTTDEGIRRNYFEDRAENIRYCFETDATFRKLITDDVIELRDLLLS